jgi:hypothetical protein
MKVSARLMLLSRVNLAIFINLEGMYSASTYLSDLTQYLKPENVT